MGSGWRDQVETTDNRIGMDAQASPAVSASSTLVGDAEFKQTSFQVRQPHRRAISALALTRAPAAVVGSAGMSSPISASPQTLHSSQKLPFLMRSNSNPSLPSFKAKETRVARPEGTSAISGLELCTLLAHEDPENLLILDVRPFVDFSRATIQSALHVCLPSTLLRRATFTLERLVDNLPEDVRQVIKPRLLEVPSCSNLKVIIFDNTEQQIDSSVSIGCHGMASKFCQSSSWTCPETKPAVYILDCGFLSFMEMAPEWVQTPPSTTLSPTSSNISPTSISGAPDLITKPRFSNHSIVTASPSSIPESPLSSCSPVSGLLKFQLPVSNGAPPPFKIARNEEVSNLESYLSAVNLGEKQRSLGGGSVSSLENLDFLASPSNSAFKFPTATPALGQTDLPFSNSSGPDQVSKARADKLSFQRSFLNLHSFYDGESINSVVPRWFQDLAHESKLAMVSQFQKIDLLEKKRLSLCLSNSNKDCKAKAAASMAKNAIYNVDNNDCNGFCAAEWLDDYNSDEEDQNITVSSGVELGTKNRYKDIFPYEHTRVVLKKALPTYQSHYANEIWDTYINANYLVNPFVRLQTPRASDCINVRYIATQAPLEATIHDFYTCILNNNVPLILSLTDEFENGVEKCCRFWAEGNYDGIQIKLLDESNLEVHNEAGPVTLRRIQVTYDDNRTFEVLQAQIKNWPDLGVMVNPHQILEMISLKNVVIGQMFEQGIYPKGHLPTILVHCSAGCGRTGTLCTLDTVLSNMSKFDSLKQEWVGRKEIAECNPWSPKPTTCLSGEVFDPVIITINKFRKQRISMVQNVNQYLFIYDCLLSYFDIRLQEKTAVRHTSNPFRKSIKDLDIVRSFLQNKTVEAGH